MQIKTILTRLTAAILARSIRQTRRRLRDHIRREERLIARDTKRLRGLRLWNAWAGKKVIPLPAPKSQGLAALLPTNQATARRRAA